MSRFLCPVCKKGLIDNQAGVSCENGHAFDRAKSGYINLLQSQQPKSRRHGDDRMMVKARRDFLSRGYYEPLLTAICEASSERIGREGASVLDAGCGECYYLSGIYGYLAKEGKTPAALGVDISKDALIAGAKRCPSLELAVASVYSLPVEDASIDLLLSVFAPFSGSEALRVLKKDGSLIRVVPLARHLWSLKEIVYDKPYENDASYDTPDGFSLIYERQVKERIILKNTEDIRNVFTMTPYYYRTPEEGKGKLYGLSSLETETEFGIFVYRKDE